MDKAAILSDAMHMVTQLRIEAQKLKESNESLQEKIKELKVSSNSLVMILFSHRISTIYLFGNLMLFSANSNLVV